MIEFVSSCSKEPNVNWLLRLFHSCNRVQKYAETEMVQVCLAERKIHTGNETFTSVLNVSCILCFQHFLFEQQSVSVKEISADSCPAEI